MQESASHEQSISHSISQRWLLRYEDTLGCAVQLCLLLHPHLHLPYLTEAKPWPSSADMVHIKALMVSTVLSGMSSAGLAPSTYANATTSSASVEHAALNPLDRQLIPFIPKFFSRPGGPQVHPSRTFMPPLRIAAAIRRQCIPTPLVYRSQNPEGTRPDLVVQTSIRVEIALIRLLIIGRLPRAMRFQSPGLPSGMVPLLPSPTSPHRITIPSQAQTSYPVRHTPQSPTIALEPLFRPARPPLWKLMLRRTLETASQPCVHLLVVVSALDDDVAFTRISPTRKCEDACLKPLRNLRRRKERRKKEGGRKEGSFMRA